MSNKDQLDHSEMWAILESAVLAYVELKEEDEFIEIPKDIETAEDFVNWVQNRNKP